MQPNFSPGPISPNMSLLIPDARDHIDAHADLDQDELYEKLLEETKQQFPHQYQWQFAPVDGFFKQSLLQTDDMQFNYTDDFGVLKPWDEVTSELHRLNQASENIQYKLLFLARHGQGWHNIASQKYPKHEWMSKWRFLGTDGELTWGPDANLTDLGIKQAQENNVAWTKQLENGAPLPSRFLVSPLQRSIHTLKHTWHDKNYPRPLVVENLRETIGIHLCHQRSPKSIIQKQFDFLDFEDSFTEQDILAQKYSVKREELNQQFLRINGVLQSIFTDCDDNIILITSHAGTIRSFITVIGHRKFTIPTGGMIPIVVRGERK